MTIGEAMRAAREKAGLTRKQLEKASGVYESSICEYEHDNRIPLVQSAELLADALGISIDEYVGHEVKERQGNT